MKTYKRRDLRKITGCNCYNFRKLMLQQRLPIAKDSHEVALIEYESEAIPIINSYLKEKGIK